MSDIYSCCHKSEPHSREIQPFTVHLIFLCVTLKWFPSVQKFLLLIWFTHDGAVSSSSIVNNLRPLFLENTDRIFVALLYCLVLKKTHKYLPRDQVSVWVYVEKIKQFEESQMCADQMLTEHFPYRWKQRDEISHR